jgi:hypothetical protein
MRRDDNRTAMWDPRHVSQPYRPPWPVTGIALLYSAVDDSFFFVVKCLYDKLTCLFLVYSFMVGVRISDVYVACWRCYWRGLCVCDPKYFYLLTE